jgi:chromosome segregation ATPase
MKIVVILLSIAVLVLGVLYFQSAQRPPELRTILVTNQLVTAVAPQTDVGDAKTQLEKQTERVTELEQKVGTLEIDKKNAEDRFTQAKRSVLAEEAKLAELESESQRLASQLSSVSNQLVSVQDQLSTLKKTNTANEEQIQGLRQQHAALEQEKATLEQRLNNLDDLRSQLRLVKRELWEKKIGDSRRQDAELAAKGNRGYLFRNGE